jgi:hypothetical protein
MGRFKTIKKQLVNYKLWHILNVKSVRREGTREERITRLLHQH